MSAAAPRMSWILPSLWTVYGRDNERCTFVVEKLARDWLNFVDEVVEVEAEQSLLVAE